MKGFTGEPDTAGPGLTWYESVQFCRWLTTQHGFSEDDQPYPAMESRDAEKFPREGNPSWAVGNWPIQLDRRGFRLPTEAEWEAACRAGMRTRFGHGGDEQLLGQYAWFAANSKKRVHAPKERRPGPRGLFDMHGNLFEWSHD